MIEHETTFNSLFLYIALYMSLVRVSVRLLIALMNAQRMMRFSCLSTLMLHTAARMSLRTRALFASYALFISAMI